MKVICAPCIQYIAVYTVYARFNQLIVIIQRYDKRWLSSWHCKNRQKLKNIQKFSILSSKTVNSYAIPWGKIVKKPIWYFLLVIFFGADIGFRSLTVKNDDPRNSLYITIFVVSKKLEYGSRVVQKSNYRKQQKVWRSRFEMVLSWQNWQNLLRQMLNSEYLTKNWIISTNTGSTSVTQIILMLLDGAWRKLRKFLTRLTVTVQGIYI